ncbi:GNAT family N-acetyltransferase [bacterium]|nr:GNAT family N-acetyltransferase [candidate division CSSED10-310 bacterium]
MISSEIFASDEARLGHRVHHNDQIWWVRKAPYYYKPLYEFGAFPAKQRRPKPFLSLMGYSHQVTDPAEATHQLLWNILEGDDLAEFCLERLKSKRRNMVRGGLRDCRVEELGSTPPMLEQMRQITMSQASRFEANQVKNTYLSRDYYEVHADRWLKSIQELFAHRGHRFFGAFVDDRLVAYVNIISIEDTWSFGAVKSDELFLKHKPVDALYYTILQMASACGECKRVLNGGGQNERESLAHFKREFLFKPVMVPYFSKTIISRDHLKIMKKLLIKWNR